MKKTIILFIALLLLCSISYANNIKIIVDNNEVVFSDESGIPFIDENGRTQVPFRATLEEYGAVVSWDAERNMALATKDGIEIGVPIGHKCIYKNGSEIVVDSGALIKEGRTYLPIRAVMEAFGCEVGWDQGLSAVSIHSTKHDTVTNTHENSHIGHHNYDANHVFYWTPNGKSYHSTSECTTLSRSTTIIEGTSDMIDSSHDDPCDKCVN